MTELSVEEAIRKYCESKKASFRAFLEHAAAVRGQDTELIASTDKIRSDRAHDLKNAHVEMDMAIQRAVSIELGL